MLCRTSLTVCAWGFFILRKLWPSLLKIDRRGQNAELYYYGNSRTVGLAKIWLVDTSKLVQHDELDLCQIFQKDQ